jgi:lactate/malate dehydrogenase, NAD binding domain
VGTACVFAVVMRGCATELVLLDIDKQRARGVVSDLRYGTALSPAVTVRDGDYPDLAGAKPSSLPLVSMSVLVVRLTAASRKGGFVY